MTPGRLDVSRFLQNGLIGGGPYTYFTGTYSSEGGIFKTELVLNKHMPPPPDHVFYNAKDVGIGRQGQL
jgi:hypothetical protein